MIPPNISVTIRSALRQRGRTVSAIAVVAAAVVAMLLASGFIEWNLRFGRESTIHSQLGHLRVYRQGYQQSGQAFPFRFLLPASGPERDAIATAPHVVTAAPRLSFAGLVSLGDSTLSFLGEGIDPDREAELSRLISVVDGQPPSASDPKGFFVGKGLADTLGARIGDTLVLVATSKEGGVNAIEGTLRGTFATITKAYDDAAIRVPIEAARSLLKVTGVHHWAVVLDDTDRTEAVATQLRAALAGKGAEVVTWSELADFYNKTATLFRKQMNVMKAIIAVIVLFSVANTMMMTVLERTAEIGTRMAIGTRRRDVMTGFLVEGAMVGGLGALIGIAAGVVLGALISWVGIPMPPAPGMTQGFRAEVLLTPGMAIEAWILATAVTTIASLYPAWRASRLPIVDALRYAR